jgi:cold shock CspA family protein
MRRHGVLIEWRDTRGFGFIEPAGSNERVFVRLSSFRASEVRPHAGLVVSYELGLDAAGRKQAIDVLRPGDVNLVHAVGRPLPMQAREYTASAWLWGFVVIAAVAGFAFLFSGEGWSSAQPAGQVGRLIKPPAHVSAPAPAPAQVREVESFQCDGRTRCPQMRSCAEAEYFLRNCPGVEMDGDYDGVPCEMQWCR